MAPPPPRPILATLFDMDGLLIDSEDLYTLITNLILAEHSRPPLPWSIKAQMQGRPGPAAGAIFHTWAQLPITREEFMRRQTELQKEHFPATQPLPGVVELLSGLRDRGVEMALATSSHKGNFKIKTDHLEHIFNVFGPEHKVLGDDVRIPKGRGKPAPDIYLLALQTINTRRRSEGKEEILPEQCLVFEDSVPGVESGRRAGMQVVWCPHPGLRQEFKGREEEVLAGLTGEFVEGEAVREKAGVVGDGWGVHLETLENFPYERFGLGSWSGRTRERL
ncbi:hypothetical protein LTR95_014691 [Oleoguttula sp. CCFEE 5521]